MRRLLAALLAVVLVCSMSIPAFAAEENKEQDVTVKYIITVEGEYRAEIKNGTAAAVIGSPSVPDGLGWQELDAQAYIVGICGKFIPNGNTADVWLTNPVSNTVWLKVRVLDEKGNALGETGLIKPGEYVQSVELDTVPKAGTPIVLKIMAYQPDTYYSEGAVSLNTAINEE